MFDVLCTFSSRNDLAYCVLALLLLLLLVLAG
jgi:hypothetical protein